MLIYYFYIPSHTNGRSKCSYKLICGIKPMETHDNITIKVVMPVATMVAEVGSNGSDARVWGAYRTVDPCKKDGDEVLW
jgi:hypothetical protein